MLVIKSGLAKLYLACGALAALFMVAIALFVLFAIGGGIFGYVVRAADEYAGFCMAASSFLALAHTFGKGEHIRVGLLIQRLQGTPRRIAEIWCLGAAAFLSGYLAWFSIKLVFVSWQLNDVSEGLVPTPLWIPQTGMAIGAAVFFLATLEQLIDVATGGPLPEEAGADSIADR